MGQVKVFYSQGVCIGGDSKSQFVPVQILTFLTPLFPTYTPHMDASSLQPKLMGQKGAMKLTFLNFILNIDLHISCGRLLKGRKISSIQLLNFLVLLQNTALNATFYCLPNKAACFVYI